MTSLKKKQRLFQKQEKILKRKLFSPTKASSNLMTKFRIQKIVWLMLKSQHLKPSKKKARSQSMKEKLLQKIKKWLKEQVRLKKL